MLVLGIILLVLAIFFLVLTLVLVTNGSEAALPLVIVTAIFALAGLGTIIDYKNAYDRAYCSVEAKTYYVDTLVTRKMCAGIMDTDTAYIIYYKTADDIKREQKIHKDDN